MFDDHTVKMSQQVTVFSVLAFDKTASLKRKDNQFRINYGFSSFYKILFCFTIFTFIVYLYALIEINIQDGFFCLYETRSQCYWYQTSPDMEELIHYPEKLERVKNKHEEKCFVSSLQRKKKPPNLLTGHKNILTKEKLIFSPRM